MAYRDAQKIRERLPESAVVSLKEIRPKSARRQGDRVFSEALKTAQKKDWLDEIFG